MAVSGYSRRMTLRSCRTRCRVFESSSFQPSSSRTSSPAEAMCLRSVSPASANAALARMALRSDAPGCATSSGSGIRQGVAPPKASISSASRTSVVDFPLPGGEVSRNVLYARTASATSVRPSEVRLSPIESVNRHGTTCTGQLTECRNLSMSSRAIWLIRSPGYPARASLAFCPRSSCADCGVFPGHILSTAKSSAFCFHSLSLSAE